MKTLHELAIEYAKSIYQEEYDDPTFAPDVFQTKNDFAAGYNAAQEWISVEDELPKDGTEILVKNTEWTDYMFYTSDDEDTIRAEYTHWRPINND
jgi:hypothetical protein